MAPPRVVPVTVSLSARRARVIAGIDVLTLRVLAARAVLLWLLLRLVLTAVVASSVAARSELGGALGSGLVLHPVAATVFAAIVAAVALIDMRATREEVFLANLGIGARHVFALTAAVAVLLEMAAAGVAAAVLRLVAGS